MFYKLTFVETYFVTVLILQLNTLTMGSKSMDHTQEFTGLRKIREHVNGQDH